MLEWACALLIGLLVVQPADPAPEPQAPDRSAAVKQAVEAAGKKGFSGVVLAAVDGEPIAVVAVGRNANGAPPKPDTLFEIASVTKTMTAAAVVRLADMGKLSLDDPISKHLPGVPANCRAITIRHLLQHTSGIPGTNSEGGGDDLRAVLPVFLKGGPRHKPGTHFEYWNQGYALLSEIIARAAGEPYTSAMRRLVFEPAGMKSTVFTGDRAPTGASVAQGRSRMGPPRSALEHPYGAYGFQYRGMGGVVTNVRDMLRFDRALADEDLFGGPNADVMFEPGQSGYALGWLVRRGPYGEVHEHTGLVRGFTAVSRRYADRDGFIVVLCNDDAQDFRLLVDAIEAALYAGTEDRVEGGKGVVPLVGLYTGERGSLLVIEAVAPDAAAARIVWSEDGPVTRGLIKMGADGRFTFDDGSSKLVLTAIEAEGRVMGVRIDAGDRSMTYTRE